MITNLLLLACTSTPSVTLPPGPTAGGPTTPPLTTLTPPDTAPTGPVDTGTDDTGTAVTTQVGFPWVDYDCSLGVPAPPFAHRILAGTGSNEDIVLDMDGYLVAADWSGNLIHYTHDGDGAVWATSFGDPTGLEVLPDGDLAVADRSEGRVVTRDSVTGAVTVVESNIAWPNGLEIAPDGSIFVNDTYEGAVYRIEPATGLVEQVASGLPLPDGLTFDVTYHTLYVGSLGGPQIFSIPVNGPGDFGEPVQLDLPEPVPWEYSDGMAVDRCGNLYIADFWGSIWRVFLDTKVIEPIYQSTSNEWIPAIRFGSNLGGFDGLKLYASTYTEALEIDIGVPGKPRWPAVWP